MRPQKKLQSHFVFDRSEDYFFNQGIDVIRNLYSITYIFTYNRLKNGAVAKSPFGVAKRSTAFGGVGYPKIFP
jgi:hypothetical protein